jgi:hypothetical protein
MTGRSLRGAIQAGGCASNGVAGMASGCCLPLFRPHHEDDHGTCEAEQRGVDDWRTVWDSPESGSGAVYQDPWCVLS